MAAATGMDEELARLMASGMLEMVTTLALITESKERKLPNWSIVYGVKDKGNTPVTVSVVGKHEHVVCRLSRETSNAQFLQESLEVNCDVAVKWVVKGARVTAVDFPVDHGSRNVLPLTLRGE